MGARGEAARRARGAPIAVAAGLAAHALAGCSLLSDFDGLTGGEPSCIGEYVDVCDRIPRVPSGFAQEVDGSSADLCAAVASDTFKPKEGHYRTTVGSRCPPPGWLADAAPLVIIHAGWSDEALHIHVHVDKTMDIVPSATDELYDGDAIEIFVGNAEAPTGSLAADHARHLMVAPPSQRSPKGYFRPADSSAPPFSGRWIARRGDDSYDVEIKIPWSFLGGTEEHPPAAGRKILWNLGIDLAEPAPPPGQERARFQSFLHYEDPDGSIRYCRDEATHNRVKPSVDDRSWCTPTLSP